MLILRSRRVVLPTGESAATLHLEGGRIARVSTFDDVPSGADLHDFGEAAIAPGAIDVHVHANEPGRTDWEGLESATRAAVAGGITTLVDMPLNSHPVTTSAQALQAKLSAAKAHIGRSLWCDVGFWGGLIEGNASQVTPLLDGGVLGLKAFLVDSGLADFPAARQADLRAVMPLLAERGVPLLVHAELESEAGMDPMIPIPPYQARSYRAYLDGRPPQWEMRAIEQMIALCEATGCRVHIVHLSTAQALPMLRAARAKGLPLSVETCPHYLLFCSEEIGEGDTFFKCAPPIRDRANREALWDGLRDGTIDFVASDHSPCPPAMKRLEEGDFAHAWGGISGLQWLLCATWTGAMGRGFSLLDLARWTSERPAKLLGLEAEIGQIAPGFAANLCVWEPSESFEVRPENTHHRHKASPYTHQTLYGRIRATYLRGEAVFRDGAFLQARGQLLLRDKAHN